MKVAKLKDVFACKEDEKKDLRRFIDLFNQIQCSVFRSDTEVQSIFTTDRTTDTSMKRIYVMNNVSFSLEKCKSDIDYFMRNVFHKNPIGFTFGERIGLFSALDEEIISSTKLILLYVTNTKLIGFMINVEKCGVSNFKDHHSYDCRSFLDIHFVEHILDLKYRTFQEIYVKQNLYNHFAN